MNYQKYTGGQVSNELRHDLRQAKSYSNENIDHSKTHLNYDLAGRDNPYEYYKERLSQVKHLKRKDVNTMCSWMITLPKNIPLQMSEEFFKAVYDAFAEKYGEENIISSVVHMDEPNCRPHMSFKFIPVVHDKKKNIDKVSAKECVTRDDLRSMHKEIEDRVAHIMGMPNEMIGIVVNDTQEQLTQLQYKCKQLRKEIKQLQESKQNITDKYNDLEKKFSNLQNSYNDLVKSYNDVKDALDAINKAIDEANLDDATMAKLEQSLGMQAEYEERKHIGEDLIE